MGERVANGPDARRGDVQRLAASAHEQRVKIAGSRAEEVLMIRYLLMVVAIVTILAGCAAMEAPGSGTMAGSPPQAFAHRVANSEVVLLWNCLEPGLLQLEGVVRSPWQAQPILELEFDLVGVDAQERTTAQTAGAAPDFQIFTNQSTSFQLPLKNWAPRCDLTAITATASTRSGI